MNHKITKIGVSLKTKSAQLKSWASLLAVPAVFLAPGAAQSQDKNHFDSSPSTRCCTKVNEAHVSYLSYAAKPESQNSFEIVIPRFNHLDSAPIEIFNNPAQSLVFSHETPTQESLAISHSASYSPNQEYLHHNLSNTFSSHIEALGVFYLIALCVLAGALGFCLSGAKPFIFDRKRKYALILSAFYVWTQKSLIYTLKIKNSIAQCLQALRYYLSLWAGGATPQFLSVA